MNMHIVEYKNKLSSVKLNITLWIKFKPEIKGAIYNPELNKISVAKDGNSESTKEKMYWAYWVYFKIFKDCFI
jgi:hypothetical protein